VGDPARSSRLAQVQPRLWGGAATEEESRAALQARLNAYSKLMFWSFVALLIFLSASYRIYDIAPKYTDIVFGGSAVMLAVMAFVWRALLYRKDLSVDALYRIDYVYAAAIGSSFGASAALQFDLRPAAFTSLIFASFTVFTRALFVPSTAKHTAVVSSITFAPIMGAGVFLGITTHQDLPPAAYVGGGVLICTVAVLVAANGSRIIYGLRQQVTEAMQLGSYTRGRKIGAGGNGSVYHASHALLRRPTAIKLLNPDRVGADDLERFEREVQTMSLLTHPNTVTVFDYGPKAGGGFYYAMEYLPGIDLEQLVRKHQAQPAGRVIHILTQICGALQEAHDAGLIHRDVKPANIILCERGGVPDVAKLVDFGLVRDTARDAGVSTEIILGTPKYMAPEQALGDRMDHRADLYALGAVAYYLLTGQPVFTGKTSAAMLVQHATSAPVPPSQATTNHVPPALEAAIMRCLAKDPADRFPSARALAAELEPLKDWSLDEASQWWRDFAATEEREPPSSDAPTMSITIDLAHRNA
jgi:serine/threonine-protein kinase